MSAEAANDNKVKTSPKPGIFLTALFVLLAGGPPRFRLRDAAASLRGDVDGFVIFQLAIWAIAGGWVVYQLVSQGIVERRAIHLPLPQKFGAILVSLLAVGILVSDAPALTAFKIYQIAAMMLWALLFVQRYGTETCLRALLLAYTIYCVVAGVAAICAPDAMFEPTNVGVSRLVGDLVVLGFAPMAASGMILTLSAPLKLSGPVRFLLFLLFASMVLLNATRSAYLCLLAFALFAILKGSASPLARRVGFGLVIGAVLVVGTGVFQNASARIVRETEQLDSLDGRTGLWKHLSEVTLEKSPIIGLGYYAASRKYGLEYAEWSGTAHSAFVEVLAGGGVLSLAAMIALWVALSISAAILLARRNDALAFAACSLLVCLFLASNVGEGIDAGPTGFTFWCVAAILPALRLAPLRATNRKSRSAAPGKRSPDVFVAV